MKTKLSYTVRTTRAPGETRDVIVPVIVERLSPVELETVVENCIDRGLIAGLKPTAAHGIAEGVAAQIAKEFTLGRGVQFGRFFYGRPYLSGTVDANGRLTSENGINVRLYKGDAFKLSLDDFSFTFDGAGDAVKVDFLLSDFNGSVRGELVQGAAVNLNGRNLYAAGDTDKVTFSEVGGTATVEVSDFAAQGAELLSFAWPSGLVAGKSYRVEVERTDANGVTRTSAAKTVTVRTSEIPPTPPTPIAQTSDGQVKVMSLSGGNEGEYTFGDRWTAHGEGFRDSESEWFVELGMLLATPSAEPVNLDCQVTSPTALEIAPSEGAELAAGDYPNAAIQLGMAHYVDGELVSETLDIPIHLVVE